MISTSTKGASGGKLDYVQVKVAWKALLKRQSLLLSLQASLGFEYVQNTEGTELPHYMVLIQFYPMNLEMPYIYFRLGIFQFLREFLY